MERAPYVLARGWRTTRRSRRRWLAGPSSILAALVLMASATAALASTATAFTGNIDVGDMSTTMPYGCPGGGCTAGFAGSSSGDIAGVDDAGSAFEVVWPDPATTSPVANLSGTLNVSAICPITPPVLLGGTITSAAFTITGAELVYGNNRTVSNATIQGNFNGFWEGETMYTTMSALSVSGAVSITIPVNTIDAQGVMQLTPIPAPTGCLTNSQEYSISGSLLTAE